MQIDLMKPQVIQGTFTTRSVALPLGIKSVCLALAVSDPSATVIATLEGLFSATWVKLLDYQQPGPAQSVHTSTAERVRIVLDPDRPSSIGVTITY